MNEIGEVNVDGQEVGVPMAEMLSGCIYCSVTEDFGTTIQILMEQKRPKRTAFTFI